ncbi:MAG: alpha/beta hydrolase family protein [Kiritimatiellia bacterium]
MKFLLSVAFALLSFSLSAVPSEHERSEKSRSPWDLKALDLPPETHSVTIPASNSYGRVAGVEPVFIAGEPYRGRPSRIFAWWGLPAGATAKKKAPAMVLVHGGGGTAFAHWVKIWNGRGYAAIAMDTCGKIPQGERDGEPHPAHPWSGPSGWGRSVAQMDAPFHDQWTYHAVAAVMRCHSFLRARPEVDAGRIGLTGISWGGYLTSIVMSVDDRFRFAAPVYGCGWYDLNPQWDHMSPDREKYRAWLARWDPKNYLPGKRSTAPVLWCTGTNDRWYPLDALRNSCSALPTSTPLLLSIKLRMPHGHPPAGDPGEITALADQMLNNAPALPAIRSTTFSNHLFTVHFKATERAIAKADLLLTCATNALLADRAWEIRPIPSFKPGATSFSVLVPPDAQMFFANLTTDDGLVFSTRVQTPVSP